MTIINIYSLFRMYKAYSTNSGILIQEYKSYSKPLPSRVYCTSILHCGSLLKTTFNQVNLVASMESLRMGYFILCYKIILEVYPHCPIVTESWRMYTTLPGKPKMICPLQEMYIMVWNCLYIGHKREIDCF